MATQIENPELMKLKENETSAVKSLARMRTENKAPQAIRNKENTLKGIQDSIKEIEEKEDE